MDTKIRKIAVILILALTCSFLTLGLLAEPKLQVSSSNIVNSPSSLENNVLSNNTSANTSKGIANFGFTQNITPPDYIATNEIQTQNSAQIEQSGFQVTTDYGFICATGDPSEVIQNALDSLPEQRTTPCNVYLQGLFNIIQSVVMKNNVNFIGNNATLILDSQQPMFINDWGKNYSEAMGATFMISDKTYQDWIPLHNVTFQYIHFKQLVSYNSQYSSAIYFYDGNSTGWGVSDNLSVFYCEFEGFYNCMQGLAINSSFVGNYFHDYLNNAIMFPAGYNLTFKNNIFDTPNNELSAEQYQERDGPMSIQAGIALFFMDVSEDVLIDNNTFIQGDNSTGITFSSSCGFTIINNTFLGNGAVYSMDVFPRPWLSSGIRFYNNTGVEDFYYKWNYASEVL